MIDISKIVSNLKSIAKIITKTFQDYDCPISIKGKLSLMNLECVDAIKELTGNDGSKIDCNDQQDN